jgi:hypothetical protein
MPGGREEFIFNKSLGSEFDKIQEMQGVRGRLKPSKGTISEEIMQRVCRVWNYSKSKISKEIILERV